MRVGRFFFCLGYFLVFTLAAARAAPPSPFICAPNTEPHVCEMLKALHDEEIDKFNALGDNAILKEEAANKAAWWRAYIIGVPPEPALAEHIKAACDWRKIVSSPLTELCAWWRDLHKAKPAKAIRTEP